MKFAPRILILFDDADAVAAQLAGTSFPFDASTPLRNDVSTDEITPLPVLLNFDEKLARFAHTGTRFGGEAVIGLGALADAGFEVIVGGRRYGKGSSREHSPLAERSAGIRLVIAESFERIYRQNCDNLGIFTSTDYGLIERIRAGEEISVDELVADRDPLAAAILREGGLLTYGQRHLAGAEPMREVMGGPQTLAQKIVSRARLKVEGLEASMAPGSGGFIRADWRFIHEYYTGMAAHMLHSRLGRPLELFDPGTILLFEDHLSYSHRSPTHVAQGLLPDVRALSQAHRAFARDYGLKDHGYLLGEEGSEGISHAMMTELYALPGQLIVGTDSHTTHLGALGCFAYGVGTTDMANAFVTGACRLTMAESLLVRLEGSLRPGVAAKDVALAILATPTIRDGGGLGRIFEFAGPVIDAMSLDDRATLTNMVAEMGGLTGICAPDDKTVAFIKERRGIDFEIEDWMQSDPDASYADVLTLDCGALGPMLATPGDPGNGIALSEFGEDIHVDIAYGGSCTAGKRSDFDAYHEVALWAQQHGLSVPADTKLFLQCGTLQVRDYCKDRGYMEAFHDIGAEILGPACGSCGQCGPGVSTDSDQVTISAINRNFPGRGGPGKTWLASPATVLASAIAGRICGFDELKAAYTG